MSLNIQNKIEEIRNQAQQNGNTRGKVADLLTEINNEKIDKNDITDITREVVGLVQTSNGWYPVYEEPEVTLSDGSKITVRKITDYKGGVGAIPSFLAENIGKYYAKAGGFTSDVNLATNYKGMKGSDGTGAAIASWIPQSYTGLIQVIKDEKIWELPSGQSAISTEVPGTSVKWVKKTGEQVTPTFDKTNSLDPQGGQQIYNASDVIVEKAFEEIGTVEGFLGKDLNHTQVASNFSPAFFQFNNRVLSEVAVFKKLKIWSGNSATLKYFHINYNTSTNTVVVKENDTVNVVSGNNEFVLDLAGEIGDTIAIQPVGMDTGHTAGSSDIEYSNGQTPPGFNAGYLAYIVEYETQGQAGYTIPEMKNLFDKVKSSSIGNTSSERITIEGQSNALGVALTSGLTSAPYNTALFDWTKFFSRVFIWNPKTDTYENIKIGFNNMASWDGYYTEGAPTNQPTFGPEIGIAIMWLQTHTSGNLYIDKNVGDGKPIAYFQKGGAYYTEKLSRKLKADKWLRDRGISVSEAGFVWVQGEGDMSQTKDYYKAQLITLINDRITDGFIDQKEKIIITQIPSSSGNYGAGVANAKSEYVIENKTAVLVPYTNNFNADNIHLNTTGQINLGMKAAVNIMITDSLTFPDLQTKLFWTF